jgi:hypothetical protein
VLSLVLLLVTVVLFALFLGGGLVAQGYLYQAPADRMPVRALGAAVLVGVFLTFWVWLDQRRPRKYDTFFEFAPYETKTFDEVEALRWQSFDGKKMRPGPDGNPAEFSVKFRRGVGKDAPFAEEGTGTPFVMAGASKASGEQFMTVAIKLKPEPDGEVVRFNAKLKDDITGRKVYTPDQQFVEEKGSRYVQGDQMGVLYVPSNTTVFLALLINFVHFVVWFVAFWAILHFTRGHAFILAVSFGLATMVLVMPLLFKPNRAPPAPAAPQAALRQEPGDRGQGAGARGQDGKRRLFTVS